MKNITKIANEILSSVIKETDSSTIRGIKILWKQYSDNIKEFSKRLLGLIKRNQLSMSVDRNWLLKALKQITGEDWIVSKNDFVVASKHNAKKSKWVDEAIKKILSLHNKGERLRMINVYVLPGWEKEFKNEEKAKQALYDAIADLAKEGKELEPEKRWGNNWYRKGKPPLVIRK